MLRDRIRDGTLAATTTDAVLEIPSEESAVARKPNYDFEKRRKEQARKQKQEEKRLRKEEARLNPTDGDEQPEPDLGQIRSDAGGP